MSCLKLKEYEILPVEAYKIIRNCPGCGCKSTYRSTNNFRLNANGNKIDVWLIYQCSQCKDTYNLTIYQRVKPAGIPQDNYRKFMSNELELALRYGLNKQLLSSNKVEISRNDIEYKIVGENRNKIFIEESFIIKNSYEIKLRIDKLLSEILGISRSKIKSLIANGNICFEQKNLGKSAVIEVKGGIMMKQGCVFKKNYRDNDELRKSFNKLAEDTFGLNFESWYQNGYWKELYNPYSMLDEKQVVANVSVNRMKFIENGCEKNYIQIGTVMTHKSYRKQGLISVLIKKVIRDYENQVDGFYLFANDEVLEFYTKFGFRKSKEYQYIKEVRNNDEMKAVRLSMKNKEKWNLLENAMKNSVSNTAFEMVNNPGLIMFYATNFMRECIYYIESMDVYVIAEILDEKLFVHNIFSNREVDLNIVIKAFGKTIKYVMFGFTPYKINEFELREYHKDDTTLFVMGKDFDSFEEKKLLFPTLSHA